MCNLVARGKELTLVEEVTTTVQEKSSNYVKPCSAWVIPRTLVRAFSMVHKILRNILNYYPYKIIYMQDLFPSDLPASEAAPLKILARMGVEKEWP